MEFGSTRNRCAPILGCAALLVACVLLAGTSGAQGLEAAAPEISAGGAMAGQGVVIPPTSGVPMAAPAEPLSPPPVVSTTFTGFGFDDNPVVNGGFYFIPPDPSGAAGTDRVVAVVNAMIEARTKAGALLWRASLASFFTSLTPANALFDAKIIYDHYAGRFLVVALEKVEPGVANPSPANTSRVLLAVSKTATPASATAADWYYTATSGKFTLGGIEYWADYPGFEVDEEAVYLTTNLFAFAPTGAFGGVRLWIVNKGVVGGFYAGAAAAITVHDPYAGGGAATTSMPCQVYGVGGVGPGIGTFLVSYSSLTTGGVGGLEFAQVVRVDSPLGAVSFAQEYVALGDLEDVGGGFGFPPHPDAPQLGTATSIEVEDSRALDCVWRGGRIWFTTTVNPNAGPDTGQTTAHWVRLDTSAIPAPITLSDQGNIGGEDIAPGTTTFFPSLAVNTAGDAMFGFAASAATIYAGAYVTGREAGDAAGTVQASKTVKAGVDYYIRTFGAPRNRWGDYTGMALDPTSDAVFWAFNEYANTRGTMFGGEDGRWGTVWGSVGFTPGPSTTTSTSTSSSTSSSSSSTSTSSTNTSNSTSTSLSTSTTSSTNTTTTIGHGCGGTPLGGCIVPSKAILVVKETVPGKEKMAVVLKQLLPALSQGDFGYGPTTAYEVCLYDDTATLIADLLVFQPSIDCNAGACWTFLGGKGYKYVDKTGASDGVRKLILQGGDALKGKVVVKATNNAALGQTSLPTGIAAQLLNATQATVQVVASDGPCFGQTVTNIRRADGVLFKATEP